MVAEEGNSAPTFTCSADGSPAPILSWGGQNGGLALPREVSLVTNRQNMGLAWHRPLEYTDSGSYTCNAMNSVGSSSVTLDLLVKREYRYLLPSHSHLSFLPPSFLRFILSYSFYLSLAPSLLPSILSNFPPSIHP